MPDVIEARAGEITTKKAESKLERHRRGKSGGYIPNFVSGWQKKLSGKVDFEDFDENLVTYPDDVPGRELFEPASAKRATLTKRGESKVGGPPVAILTARAINSQKEITKKLESEGIPIERVITTASMFNDLKIAADNSGKIIRNPSRRGRVPGYRFLNAAEKKALLLQRMQQRFGGKYTLFDDAEKNILAIQRLANENIGGVLTQESKFAGRGAQQRRRAMGFVPNFKLRYQLIGDRYNFKGSLGDIRDEVYPGGRQEYSKILKGVNQRRLDDPKIQKQISGADAAKAYPAISKKYKMPERERGRPRKWDPMFGVGPLEPSDKFISYTQVKGHERTGQHALLAEKEIAKKESGFVTGSGKLDSGAFPERAARRAGVEGIERAKELSREKTGLSSDRYSADIVFGKDSEYTSGEVKMKKSLLTGTGKGGRPVPGSIKDFYAASIGKHSRDVLARGVGGVDKKFREAEVNRRDGPVSFGTQLLTVSSKWDTELPESGYGAQEKIKTTRFSRLKSDGYVPNFATGVYDSDYIKGGARKVLNKILSSGKPINAIYGPAGAGKTSMASGTRVLSEKEVDKFDNFNVIYSGGASRKGGLTVQGAAIFNAVRSSGGRITALAPTRETLTKRRHERVEKAKGKKRKGQSLEDKRELETLRGTLKAPGTQYGYLADLKKEYGDIVDVKRYALGHIPNFGAIATLSSESGGGAQKLSQQVKSSMGGKNVAPVTKKGESGSSKVTQDSLKKQRATGYIAQGSHKYALGHIPNFGAIATLSSESGGGAQKLSQQVKSSMGGKNVAPVTKKGESGSSKVTQDSLKKQRATGYIAQGAHKYALGHIPNFGAIATLSSESGGGAQKLSQQVKSSMGGKNVAPVTKKGESGSSKVTQDSLKKQRATGYIAQGAHKYALGHIPNFGAIATLSSESGGGAQKLSQQVKSSMGGKNVAPVTKKGESGSSKVTQDSLKKQRATGYIAQGAHKYALGHIPNFAGIEAAKHRERRAASGAAPVALHSKKLDSDVVVNVKQVAKYGADADRIIKKDHIDKGQIGSKSNLMKTGSGKEVYASGGFVPNFQDMGTGVLAGGGIGVIAFISQMDAMRGVFDRTVKPMEDLNLETIALSRQQQKLDRVLAKVRVASDGARQSVQNQITDEEALQGVKKKDINLRRKEMQLMEDKRKGGKGKTISEGDARTSLADEGKGRIERERRATLQRAERRQRRVEAAEKTNARQNGGRESKKRKFRRDKGTTRKTIKSRRSSCGRTRLCCVRNSGCIATRIRASSESSWFIRYGSSNGGNVNDDDSGSGGYSHRRVSGSWKFYRWNA